MKAEYINPFLIASEKIIKVVLKLEMTIGKLVLKDSHMLEDIFVIVIGVSGDFHGRVMLCLKRETACKIASIMMGKPVIKLNEMSKSAVGELANMILGRSGIIFANRGINVSISPPTIIQGDKLTISPISKNIVSIPLHLSNNEVISMEIEVKDY